MSQVMFIGVPGAFTPTCSAMIPEYIELADDIKTNGIEVGQAKQCLESVILSTNC